MYGYIYKTTNLINGKVYVGQRKTTADKRSYNSYLGSGLKIQRAIKKYGHASFQKEKIEYCETRELLNEREQYWIHFHNSCNDEIGYNISKGGKGGSDSAFLPKDFKERCRQGKLKKSETERVAISRKGIETRKANFAKLSKQQQEAWLERNRMKRKGKPPWNKGIKIK